MKSILIVLLYCTSAAFASSLVTEENLRPREIDNILYYDNSFCFVISSYQNNQDNLKTTKLGLFAHSKLHDKWIQIKKIPTEGGKFGRNILQNPKLIAAPVTWDFTSLQAEALAELPLRTPGSLLCYPEKITYNPETMIFELGFLISWEEIPDASTYLYIKRKDLLEAFEKYK